MRKVLILVLLMGLLGSSLALAADPVLVGVFGPLSGNSSIAGIHQKEGALYAAKEINASGGVLGRELEFIFEDDESNPNNTINIMNKFLYRDNVDVTMGSPNSPCVLAVMDIIEEAKTPHIVPSGVAMDITKSGNPYVFRITATDQVFTSTIVDYAVNGLGMKKLAIINDTTDYGQGGAELIQKAMDAHGLKPAAVEGYNVGTQDFTPLLLGIKNSGAEGLIIWGMYTEGAKIVQQVNQLGIDIQLFASTGVTIGNFYDLAGDAANGIIGVTGGFHPNKKDPAAQEFVKEYEAEMGYVPDMNVATGYDAVKVLAQAIKNAGEVDNEKITGAIGNIKGFEGITGTISFDEYGDGGTEALLFKVEDGTPELIQ